MATTAIPHYNPAPPTQEPLNYADLPIIDLSQIRTPEGKASLALQVRDAMSTHGFICAINHGYTPEQTQRIFDIADITFSGVDQEEKLLYTGNISETASYQGYKPRKDWHIEAGVFDQVEHYNINRNVMGRSHPQALRPFLGEISDFAHHNHYNILHPLLRLLALGLSLPEETFVHCHNFSKPGETSVRFMKYYPRSQTEEQLTKNVWLKGHTDIGTITILWSQPVAGLQILTRDGTWKWVKHIPNGLVINAGDGMEFLSGGAYRATIHRVIQPPVDQQNIPRLGVFYFCMADDDVKLEALPEREALKRIGVKKPIFEEAAPTMKEWRRSRTTTYGRTALKREGDGNETEVIRGVVVTHYN
ncbi:hypothetical protein AX16_007163 [Volvariella volvacea WC 439]|nr:hypothetical protein AX16_007163 [Volvariella volvacea WC 439]